MSTSPEARRHRNQTMNARNEQGPIPGVPRPATWVASRCYAAGERLVSTWRSRGDARRLPVPVVSVGNLTLGGTGKTPVTTILAESLAAAGLRPAIALRGYRARQTGGSDEAEEYRTRMPDVPILVGADRAGTAASRLAVDPDAFDVLLLDDGFQHRQLHRDLDIVLVDATRPALDGDLVPHGWLREPASRIQRAGLVVVTNGPEGELEPGLLDSITRHRGSPPDVVTRHRWRTIRSFPESESDGMAHGGVRPRSGRVLLVSGLGNPSAFEDHARREGIDVVDHLVLRDHAAYDDSTIERILSASTRADALLVSAKDWVKLRKKARASDLPVPVLVPEVEIEIVSGAQRLSEALSEACGRRIAL